MSLQQTLKTIRSAPDPRNEENTKCQIITPILGDLGWNPARQEIFYEYCVGGKNGGWVDIALMGPRHPVAFIEAKRPRTSLGQHVDQMLRYALYQEVDICVLTTGLEWWFYLPKEDGPPTELRFATLHVREDPIDQLSDDLETFLTRERLLSGKAKKQAKEVLYDRQRADKINTELLALWKSMLTEPDSDLIELVRQRMHEKIDQHSNHDQVAALFLSSLPQEKCEQDTRQPPPTGFRLWEKHYTVSSEDADSPGIDLLIKVTESLHQRHGEKYLNR